MLAVVQVSGAAGGSSGEVSADKAVAVASLLICVAVGVARAAGAVACLGGQWFATSAASVASSVITAAITTSRLRQRPPDVSLSGMSQSVCARYSCQMSYADLY